jgi:hypothetical protein
MILTGGFSARCDFVQVCKIRKPRLKFKRGFIEESSTSKRREAQFNDGLSGGSSVRLNWHCQQSRRRSHHFVTSGRTGLPSHAMQPDSAMKNSASTHAKAGFRVRLSAFYRNKISFLVWMKSPACSRYIYTPLANPVPSNLVS